MSCDWDNEIIEKILLEYKKHECLWNPHHLKFKDTYARTEAIKRIVRTLKGKINVRQCLCYLSCIREKFQEQQQTNPKEDCLECQPLWKRIIEEMVEKIVLDERLKCSPRITICSQKRKQQQQQPQAKNQQSKYLSRNQRKRKGAKSSKQTPVVRCYCNADKPKNKIYCTEIKMHDCSDARPRTSWGRDRDNYLDNVQWTAGHNCPVDCPEYCPAKCPPHPDLCKDKPWSGRTRHSELQPTEPRTSCSPRPSSAGRRSPEKHCPPVKPKTSEKGIACCLCPQEPARKRSTLCVDRTTSVCTKDTCPNFNRGKECCCLLNSTACKPDTCPNKRPSSSESCKSQKSSPHPKCNDNTCPSKRPPSGESCKSKKSSPPRRCNDNTCPNKQPPTRDVAICPCPPPADSPSDVRKNVCFDPRRQSHHPRVAAKFENGVLEAYSQFKVVFPLSENDCPPDSKSNQGMQTDRSTRDCGVCTCTPEGRSRSRSPVKVTCCAKTCPSRKNVAVDCVPECCLEDTTECLEPGKTMHDYVLLTPGGKYIPLIKTRSDSSDHCCEDGNGRAAEACDDEPRQCREKPAQEEDDKCNAKTTKLLLRCLEHMLSLEEQDEKVKQESKEDPCEPCRRKNVERSNESNCLPCGTDRGGNSKSNNRHKLTQNFLEILKCALDLDSKKDECDEDERRQDTCCQCDEDDCKCTGSSIQYVSGGSGKTAITIPNKTASSTSRRNLCSSPLPESQRKISRLDIRVEDCSSISQTDPKKSNPCAPTCSPIGNRSDYKRITTQRYRQSTDEGCSSRIVQKVVEVRTKTNNERRNDDKCANPKMQDACTQCKTLSWSVSKHCGRKRHCESSRRDNADNAGPKPELNGDFCSRFARRTSPILSTSRQDRCESPPVVKTVPATTIRQQGQQQPEPRDCDDRCSSAWVRSRTSRTVVLKSNPTPEEREQQAYFKEFRRSTSRRSEYNQDC